MTDGDHFGQLLIRPGLVSPLQAGGSFARSRTAVPPADGICHGRMRILTAIHPPEATRAILECLGLPTRGPPVLPAVVPDESADPSLEF